MVIEYSTCILIVYVLGKNYYYDYYKVFEIKHSWICELKRVIFIDI